MRGRLSRGASKDIDEIWDDTVERWEAAQADAPLDAVKEKLRPLAQYPDSGRRREELAPGMRSVTAAGFVIFYQSTEKALGIVRRLLESGLTQQIFADRLDIHANLLAAWMRLARQGELSAPNPILLPVRVTRSRPERAMPLEIVPANDRRVRVETPFDEDTLARVVALLEQR